MFKLRLIQMTVTKDKEENVSHACQLIKDAAKDGANMVVLPVSYFVYIRIATSIDIQTIGLSNCMNFNITILSSKHHDFRLYLMCKNLQKIHITA